MSEDVRDWWTTNKMIITDISGAALAVEDATRETAAAVMRSRSLTAPAVADGLARISAEARRWRELVNRALALSPIPDIDTDVQFRHTMTMEGKCADLYVKAAADLDMDALGRASTLQVETARQGSLIFENVRKVWPADGPSFEEA